INQNTANFMYEYTQAMKEHNVTVKYVKVSVDDVLSKNVIQNRQADCCFYFDGRKIGRIDLDPPETLFLAAQNDNSSFQCHYIWVGDASSQLSEDAQRRLHFIDMTNGVQFKAKLKQIVQ